MIVGLAAFTGRAQNFVAQWDFTNGNLNATVGDPLAFLGDTSSGTQFGTTTSLGISDINGVAANVMGFPKTTPDQGYLMPVPGPNPSFGVGANDWTLIMDILIPSASVGNKIALLEIIDSSLVSSAGADDAEFYFEGGGLSYNGNPNGAISGDQWHRIAMVSENSNGQKILKYIDGIKVGEQGNGGPEEIDGKWALDSLSGTARLFNDDNDQTEAGFVSSIQLRDVALSPGQLFAIGGATADGIPQELPTVPSFPEEWIPAADFANRDADLGLVINSGDTTIDNGSIVLTLNGEVQNATITRAGSLINVVLPSSGLYPAPSKQAIEITYTDSEAGAKTFSKEYTIPIFFEDFNSLALGPNVDEASAGDEVWTKTPPEGWVIDDSGIPGVGDPDLDGVTEWAGWSFADRDWWPTVDDQQRSQFTKSSGAVMVADPDEWDDQSHAPSEENGWYNTYIATPEISLEGVGANAAFLQFDSSWRPEFDGNYHQTANVTVSYDGGEAIELFRWVSDSSAAAWDPNSAVRTGFKPNSVNETVIIQLGNPAGASTAKLTFGLFDAGNDWWWAVDNLIVNSGAIAPFIVEDPAGREVTSGDAVSFSVVAGGGEPFSYQWFKGSGATRAAIDGETGASLSLAAATADDADLYSVDVSNSAGSASSAAARLVVIEGLGGVTLFAENFDGLPLGPNVDEGLAGDAVWTKTAPDGWTIDDAEMPGIGDPDLDGVTEWAGWSFADSGWWASAAGDQRRSEFTKSSGAAAITDPDEWDDAPHDAGSFNSFLATPEIDISGITPDTAILRFNSSFRPEGNQTATVTVSYDGGAPIEVLKYVETTDDKTNETLDLALNNPAGASSMVITFGMTEAGNNWFWAIDNIVVVGEVPALFTEGFEGLDLGPNVDETVVGANVWTRTGPTGWTVDDSGVPGAGDPANDGVTEWAGWSFADKAWWAEAAGDQRRSEFSKANGTVAVADPDEWDDAPHADSEANGWYDTFLVTPEISLAGVPANTAVLRFDSSWRPEFDSNYHQTGNVTVSFDGGSPVEVMLWESDSDSPNFKDANVDETVTVFLRNPEGASNMVISFGLFDAGNDWWWAIDNIEVAVGQVAPPLLVAVPLPFSENFDSLALGPNVDEAVAGDNVWTKTAPVGWMVDDSGVPGAGDPENDGVTEWAGWSFADKAWWAEAAGDQRRSEFSNASGVVAVADPDEWDDAPHADSEANGWYDTFLVTPEISLAGVSANTVVLNFASSWRPEFDDNYHQTASVFVFYDGADPVQVMLWESDSSSPNFKDTAVDEVVSVPLNNPPGASSMVIHFGLFDAGNDWWWAIDNIEVKEGAAPPSIDTQPGAVAAFVGDTVTLSVSASGEDLSYQWFVGAGDQRAEIAGATSAELTLAQASLDSSGTYSVRISNAGGEVFSSEVTVSVDVPPPSPGSTLLFAEDFNSVPLGPNVDEAVAGENVWTKTSPDGWVIDDSGIPGAGDPANDGVTEWAGWSFADAAWWAEAAGDQRRSEFILATGAVAVADPDEWDDAPHADSEANGWYDTFLSTPAISLAGVDPDSAILQFDSSWRPEFDSNYHQTATILASFDGGDPVEVMLWESDSSSPNYKDTAVNETVTITLNNPAGASSVVVTFGLVDAGNDWWWAFDNVEVTGSASLFSEGFEGLPLGPNVDEAVAGDNVWTRTAPDGWTVDDSGVPGAGDPATDGVTEWAGWSFADKAWWVEAAGDQRRSEFTNASGTVAVADPDEWDDADHADSEANGWYDTFLTTPEISLAGVPANAAILKFDSSWRPEFDSNYHQTADVTVSYDGGAPVQVMLWESDSNSPNFKDTAVNETVEVSLNNPAGATTMVISFGLFDAGNDWWWAIDNIDVVVGEPSLVPLPFFEDFNGLALGPNVDEAVVGENVWTKTAPVGWMVDDSGIPGAGDPENDGVTEWAGWSFADAAWWAEAAGDQRRSEFVLATGAVAVADPDEWDDAPHADSEANGWYDTFLSTPALSLAGVAPNTAALQFDSSWRPEFDSNYHQTAIITASFDGGEPVQVMLWESDSASPNFKDAAVNETVSVPLNNPAGATSVVIDFGLVDAGNDWWWAIDNIFVSAGGGSGLALGADVGANGELIISWDDGEARLQSAPALSGPWTDVAGATSPSSITPDQGQSFFRLVK